MELLIGNGHRAADLSYSPGPPTSQSMRHSYFYLYGLGFVVVAASQGRQDHSAVNGLKFLVIAALWREGCRGQLHYALNKMHFSKVLCDQMIAQLASIRVTPVPQPTTTPAVHVYAT